MTFTVFPAVDLKVIVTENGGAGCAGQTARVELLSLLRLEVLPFDAMVAARAERVIEHMVVMFAVWIVVDDVEVCCSESGLAGLADKAWKMVSGSIEESRKMEVAHSPCDNGQ